MKHSQITVCAIVAWSILAIGCSLEDQENRQPQQQQWKALNLGPQELEMVFAKLMPGTNTLLIRQGHDFITTEELDILRKQGVTGELIARGVDRRGQGDKKARVLVVMETNVTKPVDLKQPDGTNGIYLQTGDSFVLLPTNTPTISKGLRIERYDAPVDGETTDYWIDMGAVLQGGTAIIWGKKSVETK